MDSRNIIIRSFLVALATALLAGCPKVPDRQPREATVMVTVFDASVATEHRCAELAARLETTLAQFGRRRVDVSVLGTGDRSTGYEPGTVVPWRTWAPASGLYSGKAKLAAARDAWIDEARAECDAGLRSVGVSAIHTAVARAAEGVRARCREIEQQGARCATRLLAVHSDLRETVEVHVRGALDE